MKNRFLALIAGAALLGSVAIAPAQVQPVPQVSSIGPNDLFQDVVNGVAQAQSFYASAPLLGNYAATQAGNNPENWLIGGDATTNLFQRATTGSSVTTTLTYGGPDRWAYWSGTNTAMTVSQDTTAADLRPGYKAAFKMARTSGQTGVVQMCMMQVLESVNSYAFAGATAEVDFDAVTGANFSAANGNMAVVFISGTGTDQAASTAAFNFNAGGGGSSTWTGQVNTSVTVSLGGVSTTGRYGAVAPIPAGATQLAIALCYTPVGTAGTNDYVALGNIQLTRNSGLTTLAGTAGAALPANDNRIKTFARRSQALESILQYRYYWQLNDNVANTVPVALCQATTTSAVVCVHQFPAVMRAAPTATASASTAFGDTATAGAPTACTGFAVVASSASNLFGKTTCTAGATTTAGGASQLVGANTGANVNFAAEL